MPMTITIELDDEDLEAVCTAYNESLEDFEQTISLSDIFLHQDEVKDTLSSYLLFKFNEILADEDETNETYAILADVFDPLDPDLLGEYEEDHEDDKPIEPTRH